MFGTMKRGVNAYANVGLETGIASASPHKLIVMLYDGALVVAAERQGEHAAGNIAAKGVGHLEGHHDHRQRPARRRSTRMPAARSPPTSTPCTNT